MAQVKTVLGVSPSLDETWGSALRESGIVFKPVARPEDASGSDADLVLLDARDPNWKASVSQIQQRTRAPILSLIKKGINHDEIQRLQGPGLVGYLSESLPAEEFVVRVKALLDEQPDPAQGFRESRAAHRIWFQQKVEFKVFDRTYSAWSTTLSQTGIFLRTSLTFPLYTVARMKFELVSDRPAFESDGVIVRQEVEGPIRGLGVMFQNLRGENVALLESFLQVHRTKE